MKKITTALFVDPGPTRSAYALLDAYDDGSILVPDTWYATHNTLRIASAISRLGPEKWFGIETVEAVFKRKNPGQFLQTTRVEGLIEQAATERGVTPIMMTARHWRKQLLDDASPADTNEQIFYVVDALFRRPDGRIDLPPMDRIAREHCYDAIGGGIVMLAQKLQYPCPLLPLAIAKRLQELLRIPGGLLPKKVMDGLRLIQMREKAKRQERKFARESGIKIPTKRRIPTRAVQREAVAKRHATRTQNDLVLGRVRRG
jgi:hypothetical protein